MDDVAIIDLDPKRTTWWRVPVDACAASENKLHAHFRAALKSRTRESDRGND